jgi:deoxyhypusine synthase
MGPITKFIHHHFQHFNAATLKDAAESYKNHVESGGKMFLTLAGAMSTAEIGLSLADMIRQNKVHAISCTGANLEEDLFNLVAHEHYVRIPNYRDLSPQDEMKLLERHMNRVTDTCIPEEEAFRRVEGVIMAKWSRATKEKKSYLPHQFFYEILNEGLLKSSYQIDVKNSWLAAAAAKNLPLFVPGWEDSTLGNIFASHVMQKEIDRSIMKMGIDYMIELAEWYQKSAGGKGIGFFQIGGGIAGDFPICVVPMIEQDFGKQVPKWSYFCQISDSTTSYGSYSGAVPNEKITWGKLDLTSPKFVIESDASIVAPLMFAYIMGL